MSHAILMPARGYVRRLAILHARANADRFRDHIREHRSIGEAASLPAGASEEDAGIKALQAEAGALMQSLLGSEKLNDQMRAMPVYDSRPVIAAACELLAAELEAGTATPHLGADIVVGFRPWATSTLAGALRAEAARLDAGGELVW